MSEGICSGSVSKGLSSSNASIVERQDKVQYVVQNEPTVACTQVLMVVLVLVHDGQLQLARPTRSSCQCASRVSLGALFYTDHGS